MSKTKVRQSIIAAITEFGHLEDWKKSNMEEITEDAEKFYNYVENHDNLKYFIYTTFRQIFDDHIAFKFYNNPIPALEDDPDYMEHRKQQLLKEARDLFNYGGLNV